MKRLFRFFSIDYIKKKWNKITNRRRTFHNKIKELAQENVALKSEFSKIQARLASMERALGLHEAASEQEQSMQKSMDAVDQRLLSIEAKILAANMALYGNKSEAEKVEAFQSILTTLSKDAAQ